MVTSSRRPPLLLPIAAAFGGVAVPAIIYTALNFTSPTALHGWAIPTATDIAFAVSVLAAVGTFLPSAMRVFLLTLAVVDDLIAICIIAIFYTNNFHGEYLLFALIPLALFAFIAYRGETMLHLKPLAAWLLLLPWVLSPGHSSSSPVFTRLFLVWFSASWCP